MVIRIPDFLFAESTGHGPAPGELDRETRAAVAGARAAETEMTALSRGLSLASEVLTGGDAAGQRLAAARRALGPRAESGAFRTLFDRVAAERARRDSTASHGKAMRTLVGTIKALAGLPIPSAEKAELGRALLHAGVERGVVGAPDLALFEEAALSQLHLGEAQGRLAAAAAPGEALAVLAGAREAGALLPMDLALLERQAAERDAVAAARHRGRLVWKEQDDLAAFARGELPEPLGEESFRQIHGARGALGAHTRYQAARREGEALALIRGKDAEAVEEARAGWTGDGAVFDAAVEKDAGERRRDPAGYALATVPGTAAAMEETPEAERGALLWAAQAAAGIPEDQRGAWTLAEEERLAAAWDALPAGSAGRNEKLAFFRKAVLGLAKAQRASAIRRLVQQGIADGTEAELTRLVDHVDNGRRNPGRAQATKLTPFGPRHAQHAELDGERRPGIPQRSETGRIPLDDLALGAWTAEQYPEVFADAAGTRIPDYKSLDQAVKRDWISWQREVRASGAGESQNFALMEIFAAEGGLRPTPGGTVFGVTPRIIADFGTDDLPSSKDLTNQQRLALFKTYLDADNGGLGRAGGYEALEQIGDKQVAAAIADVYWRNGGAGSTIKYILHRAINDVLRSDALLARRLFELLQTNGELSSAQASVDPGVFSLVEDGKFGMQSLRAVQLIVQDESARRLLLDGIAERRIQWHLERPDEYPGDATFDTERRYPHFRFQ